MVMHTIFKKNSLFLYIYDFIICILIYFHHKYANKSIYEIFDKIRITVDY